MNEDTITNRCKKFKEKIRKYEITYDDSDKSYNKKVNEVLSDIFTLGQINMLLGNTKTPRQDHKGIEGTLALGPLSHKTYNYLRRKVELPLPGILTLFKGTINFDCLPGSKKMSFQ